MSLDILSYGHLGDINRGIQRLTRSVQAQGNAATVPVETYNQLFARYEELRAQLDEALSEAAHWEGETQRMTHNKDQWVAYANNQEARADTAELALSALKAARDEQC